MGKVKLTRQERSPCCLPDEREREQPHVPAVSVAPIMFLLGRDPKVLSGVIKRECVKAAVEEGDDNHFGPPRSDDPHRRIRESDVGSHCKRTQPPDGCRRKIQKRIGEHPHTRESEVLEEKG